MLLRLKVVMFRLEVMFWLVFWVLFSMCSCSGVMVVKLVVFSRLMKSMVFMWFFIVKFISVSMLVSMVRFFSSVSMGVWLVRWLLMMLFVIILMLKMSRMVDMLVLLKLLICVSSGCMKVKMMKMLVKFSMVVVRFSSICLCLSILNFLCSDMVLLVLVLWVDMKMVMMIMVSRLMVLMV